MDRKSWARWVNYPAWPCPACQKGTMRLVHKTFQTTTSRKEHYERTEESYYPHEVLERFTAHLKCDFAGCGETGTIAGNHLTSWVNDGTEDGLTEVSYEPLSIVPAPLPFPLGQRVPKAVRGLIGQVARLFWTDQDAAANRVRRVIEAILTDQGVPTDHASGKPMNLHLRIEAFRQQDGGKWAEQADIVEAVKWIGNEGTHETLTRENVLDAMEMLEAVIDDIYVRPRNTLLDKVRATNARNRKSRP